ncbi:hypothetical protein LOTGIDRAFT_235403 [Lottia gigantea]|uniref:Uncharacterized protein n=1 Tax=Lottia gigantea TaxID=225164 RepID=V3Z6F7_LOTGI|nr:hypothetical protein LOTGIDRAFT_235403 [Lottia gigantea]ESO86338.1 hypothetical protein LOTGIDRAFT_235403 [Lottia gigantea]
MSLKQNIILWAEAVKLYEDGDLIECLEQLNKVNVSAKIRYNQGIVNSRLGNSDKAIEYLSQALQLDSFMSVAYFQRGLLFFDLHRYNEAEKDLEDSLINLRGSMVIDYKQLGLYTQLHLAQVLYNLAVIKKFKGDVNGFELYSTKFYNNPFNTELFSSVNTKLFNTVVNLRPLYNIFCPPKGYVSNLLKKDFLGKSEVVSSVEDNDFVLRREQKSRSNPSTPVVVRKNHLDVQTHRMAVTPPPLRPPPRLKSDAIPNDHVREPDSNVHPKPFSQLQIPQRTVPIPLSKVQAISKERNNSKSVIINDNGSQGQSSIKQFSPIEIPQKHSVSSTPVPVSTVITKKVVPVRPPPFIKDCDRKLKPERPPPPRFK